MPKPDNILRVRLDAPHWQMLSELCQTHDRTLPDMVRKMIRDEHARMGKGKAKMKSVTNSNGEVLNFEATTEYMDDELREKLHDDLAPCSEQEFFTAYEQAHAGKYGEQWELSKKNPTW